MKRVPDLNNKIQKALQYHRSGQLQQAEEIYREILAQDKDHPDALHLLGLIAQRVGAYDTAMELISHALRIKPREPYYHNSIGTVFKSLGKLKEAVSHYQEAIQLNPDYAEAYNNLGNALKEQNKLEEAVTHYERALVLKPDLADVQTNLVIALRSQGRTTEALHVLFTGLATQPLNVQLRRALAETFKSVNLFPTGKQEQAILLSLCNDDKISAMSLANPIIGLIKHEPSFSTLLDAAKHDSDPFETAPPELDAFFYSPFVHAALTRMVVCDVEFEQVITNIRRHLVLRAKIENGSATVDDVVPFPFVCSLARQCFNAEYAFFADEDEKRKVEDLRGGLQSKLQHQVTPAGDIEWSLALFALYTPLAHLTGWEVLLKPALSEWSGPFQQVLQEQLYDYKREKEIATNLTTVTGIHDEISRAVKKQYEENPYPRWISIHYPQTMPVEALAGRLLPGRKITPFPRPVPILVAGCGTGHHPIQVAVTYSDCQVLAVDLSRTSLAYAARMAERFGVANIVFQQADILELGKLGRSFSIIECGGVLHHMQNPMAGWRVLVDLLQGGGLMKIALYSEKARMSLKATREFIQEQGLPLTREGIKKARRAIMILPEGHLARSALLFSSDFFSVSGCRDLLFNVQEHTFTIPAIADCLDKLGLQFLGFECDVQVSARFTEMFPGADALTDLALWERFEELHPDTFIGMYQFWCCTKS